MNSAGDRIAVGALTYGANTDGQTKIYSWSGSAWTQLGLSIPAEAATDYSGQSVSLNSAGDRVAIGARYNDDNGYASGHTRIYSWNGSSWIKLGIDIDGEAENNWSGWSVSMNSAGDRVAIGAIYNNGNGSLSGHVRVYIIPSSAGAISASTGTFTTSVSAPALSGVHFGDGSKLTKIVYTNTSLAVTPLNAFVSGGVDYYDYSLHKPKLGQNQIDIGISSSILGGDSNILSGGGSNGLFGPPGPGDPWYYNYKASYSTIVGGYDNKLLLNSSWSVIAGGSSNRITTGSYCAIVGGFNNIINSFTNSFILGSNITATASNTTFVNNLSATGSVVAYTFTGRGTNLTNIPQSAVTGLGTAASLNVSSGTTASAGEVVKGNDTRLSDARTPTTHTHSIQDITGLSQAITSTVYEKTGNYVLSITDVNSVLVFNSSSICYLRIPADTSVNLPIGTQITIIQEGMGNVIVDIVTNSGVWLDSYGSRFSTSGSKSMATLIKIGANKWRLGGALV